MTKAGTNYIPITREGHVFERVKNAVKKARRDSDLVVFSIHWGPNMRRHPTRQFVDFAHAVVDLGVDVFHGHSAHIFQGIEVHRGKPIMYDTGDFIDDYYVGPERNDQTFLFLVKAGRNGVVEIELVPALISRCQVNLARGRDAEDICRKMEVLSREMGTEVETEKNGGYHCLIKL